MIYTVMKKFSEWSLEDFNWLYEMVWKTKYTHCT